MNLAITLHIWLYALFGTYVVVATRYKLSLRCQLHLKNKASKLQKTAINGCNAKLYNEYNVEHQYA